MEWVIATLDNLAFQIIASTFIGGYASWWTARYFVRKRFRGNEEFYVGSGIIRIDVDGKEFFGEGKIESIDWDRLRVSVISHNNRQRITVPFTRFAQYRIVWVGEEIQ